MGHGFAVEEPLAGAIGADDGAVVAAAHAAAEARADGRADDRLRVVRGEEMGANDREVPRHRHVLRRPGRARELLGPSRPGGSARGLASARAIDTETGDQGAPGFAGLSDFVYPYARRLGDEQPQKEDLLGLVVLRVDVEEALQHAPPVHGGEVEP